MTDQEKIEHFFKMMLDNSPNDICLNVIEQTIKSFEDEGVEMTNIRKMFEEKMEKKGMHIHILPLGD